MKVLPYLNHGQVIRGWKEKGGITEVDVGDSQVLAPVSNLVRANAHINRWRSDVKTEKLQLNVITKNNGYKTLHTLRYTMFILWIIQWEYTDY